MVLVYSYVYLFIPAFISFCTISCNGCFPNRAHMHYSTPFCSINSVFRVCVCVPELFLLSQTQRHRSQHTHSITDGQILQIVHQTLPLTLYTHTWDEQKTLNMNSRLFQTCVFFTSFFKTSAVCFHAISTDAGTSRSRKVLDGGSALSASAQLHGAVIILRDDGPATATCAERDLQYHDCSSEARLHFTYFEQLF